MILIFPILYKTGLENIIVLKLYLSYNDLLSLLDKKRNVQLILFDRSLAFGSLNHGIIIKQFKSIGLNNTLLTWFTNLLTESHFTVKMSPDLSTTRLIKYGVIQGSSLKPILFTIYLLPISNIFFPFFQHHI